MSSTPNIDQLQRVNAFITSLEDNDLFLSHVGENVNSLGEIRSSAFHLRLATLSRLQDTIIAAGMELDDYSALMAEIRAYQFCIRLETLKATFANMLKTDRLATPDESSNPDFQLTNLTLGTLIRRINNIIYSLNGEINDSERQQLIQQRDDNQELFFRTFRNAIIHRNFELIGANLIYGPDANPLSWNAREAVTMSDQLDTLEVMINQKLVDLQTNQS